MSGMTYRHGLPTILAATGATLVLAACGGSSGNDPSAGQSDDAKRIAFGECMRKAGLNFKDDVSTGGKRTTELQVPKGISRSRLQKIQSDCAKKTGGGPREPSKAEQARFLDQALKFARCMRAHGVDMADPQSSGTGGIQIRIRKGSSGNGPDPSSPAFQSAQKACGSLIPAGKGGPGLSKTSRGGDSGPSKSVSGGTASP
jgi:hypothetical protein